MSTDNITPFREFDCSIEFESFLDDHESLTSSYPGERVNLTREMSRQLQGSLCSYNDKPYVIIECKYNIDLNDMCVIAQGTGMYIVSSMSDPKYTHTPPDKLGYFNLPDGTCSFLQRDITRNWRLGLHENNTYCSHPYAEDLDIGYLLERVLNTSLNSMHSKVNLLTDKIYPTMTEVINDFKNPTGTYISRALNKDFCLAIAPLSDNMAYLIWRGTKAADVPYSDDGYEVKPCLDWLRDTIQEVAS